MIRAFPGWCSPRPCWSAAAVGAAAASETPDWWRHGRGDRRPNSWRRRPPPMAAQMRRVQALGPAGSRRGTGSSPVWSDWRRDSADGRHCIGGSTGGGSAGVGSGGTGVDAAGRWRHRRCGGSGGIGSGGTGIGGGDACRSGGTASRFASVSVRSMHRQHHRQRHAPRHLPGADPRRRTPRAEAGYESPWTGTVTADLQAGTATR